ncbi:hypothetical protein D3C73_1248110 [compost metagenome]
MIDRTVLCEFLVGLDEPLHARSVADADRKSVIEEDSPIQQDKRTEILLYVLFSFILGSIEQYNGS